MSEKLFRVGVFMVVFLLSLGAVSAANYVLGISSVDENEIRWGGSTTYSTQWNAAISKWNEMKKINIAPDTIFTYQDLTVSDVNLSSVLWTGQWSQSAGSDTLKLNKYYLSKDTSSERQNTAMHELGHALGLAHSISNNIMYAVQASKTTLGTQDKADYTFLWGK